MQLADISACMIDIWSLHVTHDF